MTIKNIRPEPADPVALLADLIRAETVTPVAGPALDILQERLEPAGFAVHRPVFTDTDTPGTGCLSGSSTRPSRVTPGRSRMSR